MADDTRGTDGDHSKQRVPWVIWLLCAMYALVLAGYSIALPDYRSPDEPNHFDVVRVMIAGHDYPDYNKELIDTGILESLRQVRWDRNSAHLLIREALPRAKRPTIESLRKQRPTELNQIVQHPPLYYWVVGNTYRVIRWIAPDATFDSYDRQLGILRLISSLFIVPLPLLIWLITARLRLAPSVGKLAALLPLAVPQLTSIGSSVNNDTLFILLSGLFTLAIVHIATGDISFRMMGIAGLVTGLALLTKAFAFVYPLILVCAVIVAVRSARRVEQAHENVAVTKTAVNSLAPHVGIAIGGSIAFGGWWWLRNLIRFHEISPSIEFQRRLDRVPAGFRPNWQRWGNEALTRIGKTFFGNFGWYDVWIPVWVMRLCWLALVVAVVAAFVKPRKDRPVSTQPLRGNPSNWTKVLLISPFVLGGAFVAINAARLYAHSSRFVLLQGRYLFGGFAGLAVLGALGLRRVFARLDGTVSRLSLFTLMAAVFMHALAIQAILSMYWGRRQDGVITKLRTLVAWNPWPPVLIVAWALLLGGVFVLLVQALWSDQRPVQPERTATL